MDYRFNAGEWVKLSSAERVKRCLVMAHEASELARGAVNRDLKRGYLELAEHWQKLAQQMAQDELIGSQPLRTASESDPFPVQR
jgi:hypothetical protein